MPIAARNGFFFVSTEIRTFFQFLCITEANDDRLH